MPGRAPVDAPVAASPVVAPALVAHRALAAHDPAVRVVAAVPVVDVRAAADR